VCGEQDQELSVVMTYSSCEAREYWSQQDVYPVHEETVRPPQRSPQGYNSMIWIAEIQDDAWLSADLDICLYVIDDGVELR
jgi:hypothetical protein